MAYVPPQTRRTTAATACLAAPAPYDANPLFAEVPPEGWADRGYQYTLTVQWSGVPVTNLAAITVRAHVHYRWQPAIAPAPGHWVKIAGNAWIANNVVPNWSTPTTAVIVNMAPANPPNVDHHA